MITEETTTQEQAQEQENFETLHNQNGEPTALAVPETHISIEDFVRATELAKELKNKQRGASIVPKAYEFTTSVEMVQTNAEKMKDAQARENYIAQNMPLTSVIGFFKGVVEEMVEKIEKTETGEVRTQENRVITRWIGEDGLFINFGVQLARCCKFIAPDTPIEIVYVRDEPVKSKPGATVKIYEVYPLI